MGKLSSIGKKLTFVSAVISAAIVGGTATALVRAAIPDSDGTVHTCYTNKSGDLRVVDPSAGDSCTAKETGLNLNVGGSNTPTVAEVRFNADHSLDSSFSTNVTTTHVVQYTDLNSGNHYFGVCLQLSFTPKSSLVRRTSAAGEATYLAAVPAEVDQLQAACGTGYSVMIGHLVDNGVDFENFDYTDYTFFG